MAILEVKLYFIKAANYSAIGLIIQQINLCVLKVVLHFITGATTIFG